MINLYIKYIIENSVRAQRQNDNDNELKLIYPTFVITNLYSVILYIKAHYDPLCPLLPCIQYTFSMTLHCMMINNSLNNFICFIYDLVVFIGLSSSGVDNLYHQFLFYAFIDVENCTVSIHIAHANSERTIVYY